MVVTMCMRATNDTREEENSVAELLDEEKRRAQNSLQPC